jgi:sulfur carrier protein
MTILLNGDSCDFPSGATLADAVTMLTSAANGIAAACNGEVIRRGDWTSTRLHEGDRVEVVTARQGG